MQILTQRNIPVCFIDDTLNELRSIVLAAFYFIDKNEIIHTEFTGYNDWNTYVNVKGKNNFLMERIDALFKKGYSQEHFESTLSKTRASNRKHIISLMKHSKGLECDQIYVLPNIIKQQIISGDKIVSIREANELYVALTRSTHKIFLPEM